MNISATSPEKAHEQAKIVQTKQLILFELASQYYAFFIEEVSEVLATPPMSKLPLAPPYIRGLANVRGNIYTLLDLESRFGLDSGFSANNLYTYPFTLLLNAQGSQLGILLRQVPDTLEVPEASIDLTPVLMRENHTDKSYVRGIVRYKDQLLLLLDGKELTENIINKSIN